LWATPHGGIKPGHEHPAGHIPHAQNLAGLSPSHTPQDTSQPAFLVTGRAPGSPFGGSAALIHFFVASSLDRTLHSLGHRTLKERLIIFFLKQLCTLFFFRFVKRQGIQSRVRWISSIYQCAFSWFRPGDTFCGFITRYLSGRSLF
jgi:hypothetical protein